MQDCAFCHPNEKLGLHAKRIQYVCSECCGIPRNCTSSLHGTKPHDNVAKYDGKQVCCGSCYALKKAYKEKMERKNKTRDLEQENKKLRKQLLLLENESLRRKIEELKKRKGI
jgi:hypothetical protein